MASKNPFVDFVLQSLEPVGEVRARAMFGGYGIYHGETFFGIIADEVLYFKVDIQSQVEYLERGLAPFTYDARGKTMTMQYYEVPPEVYDGPDEMRRWATQAIAVARLSKKKKKAPSK